MLEVCPAQDVRVDMRKPGPAGTRAVRGWLLQWQWIHPAVRLATGPPALASPLDMISMVVGDIR